MKHSHLTRWTPAAILLIAGTTNTLAAGLFPAVFELSSLNGTNGFVCNGIDAYDFSGDSVSSAGDVNGDGIDDFIIGARQADPNGSYSGECYVVFGAAGVGTGGTIDLSSLNGTNGFVLHGIDADDLSGRTVSSAGDINGDRIDDLIIGAYRADPNGKSNAGESYVVFGAVGVGSSGTLNLSSLDGTNGFVLNGIDADDQSGFAFSSAGDVNGDGVDDLIVGAYGADPNGKSYAGASYVVFGRVGVGSGGTLNLSSLNGLNGFVCNGFDADSQSGRSVSSAGDINNDGMDDFIVGVFRASPNGQSGAGESYVVFGAIAVGSSGTLEFSSLNGSNGFVLNGIDEGDQSGYSVSSAGDINGDGVGDIIIGAFHADPNGQKFAGETYVVFGGAGVGAGGTIELSSLNGTNGFVCNGFDTLDFSGRSVSSLGDVNGDGVDDLIIGAHGATLIGRSGAGRSYVVFGGVDVGEGGTIELSSLNGTDGFVCNGIELLDLGSRSVSSAGDVNGDGVDDFIIGAVGADPDGRSAAGESYVVFGRAPCPADFNADGVVDMADLGLLLSQFNTPGPGADINGDGTVDTADLGILLGAFGTTICP